VFGGVLLGIEMELADMYNAKQSFGVQKYLLALKRVDSDDLMRTRTLTLYALGHLIFVAQHSAQILF
jgi:hypothetical protein